MQRLEYAIREKKEKQISLEELIKQINDSITEDIDTTKLIRVMRDKKY
ncbi:MAG: hypothetical protein ACE5KT_06445 [Methanosarcinales archaeon]